MQGAAILGEFTVVIPEPHATLQGGATAKFNAMSSQSHVSHCRVLLLGEFTVVIPEPHAILQGGATAKFNAMSSQSHATLQGTVTW